MKNKDLKEIFIPGEEWLYYKIYCGIGTTNAVLLDCIKPIVKSLLKRGIISKWFFIRYSDPENHIRVRFLIGDIKSIGKLIIELKKKFKPYVDSNKIWNIQIDTYKREILRYGKNTIDLSESFFFINSEHIIAGIKKSNNEESLFSFVFYYIESLIKCFNLSNEIQLLFLDDMQRSYKKEFNGLNKKTNKSLSLKYRAIKNELNFVNNNDIKDIQNIIDQIKILNQKNKSEIDLKELLSSFIHMTINRTFNINQRMFEMLLYDFLHRKYKSICARL